MTSEFFQPSKFKSEHRILLLWSEKTYGFGMLQDFRSEFRLEKQQNSTYDSLQKMWRMLLSNFSDRRKRITSEFFKTSDQNSDRKNNWLRIMTHLFHKMWRMLHRILRNIWSNDLVPLILAMEPLEYTLPIWLSFLHTVYLKTKIN